MKKTNLHKKSPKPFINLCQDLMFKTFFSKNEDILLSLVQTFIFHQKGKTVEKLSLRDQNQVKTGEEKDRSQEESLRPSKKPRSASLGDSAIYPDIYDAKQMSLDLLVKLNTGEQVNIELQSLSHDKFVERILYYWKHIYGRDFKKGDPYYKLKPAYSLVFTDFSLFETQSQEFLNSFSIRSDRPPHFVLTTHFGMTIVDLRLFSRQLGGRSQDLVDMVSFWCYFISQSARLTKADFEILSKHEVFKMAKELLQDLSMDSDLRYQELQREKAIRDSFSFVLDAKEAGRVEGMKKGHAKGLQTGMKKGRAEGLQTGRKEGRAEGLQTGMKKGHAEGLQTGLEKGITKGLQRGRVEAMQAVALNMLKEKVEISFIAKVTGLSEQEIEKLKNGS